MHKNNLSKAVSIFAVVMYAGLFILTLFSWRFGL